MKIAFRIAATIAVVAGTTAFAFNAASDETRAVLRAANFYVEGHATGDPEIMSRAFHPSARLQYLRDGEVMERSLEEYLGGMSGSPAEDESERRRRIASVDITGHSAVVKIELDYPGAFITDYMQMLKVGEEWKIVNKIFHVEPRR